MSDLVNALTGANRSSSVLGAIANPTQVNPLAAYGAAAETARQMYGARQMQAKQLAGEAFQNSIDPTTGQPNQALLMRNLQAAGPNAAMAAQDSAQAGQTLDTGTFALHSTRLAGVSAAMMSLIADNPHGVPQDQVNAAIDAQLKAGNLTPEQATAARGQFGADPVQNTKMLIQNNGRVVAAQTQLENARPNVTPTNIGGQIVPVGISPRSASAPPQQVTQPGNVNTGMSPEQANTIVQVPYPQFLDDGKTPNPNWGRTFPMRQGDMVKLLPQTPPGQSGTAGLPPSLRNSNKPAATPPPAGATPAPATPAPTTPATPAPTTPATSIGTGPSQADLETQRTQAAQNTAGFQAISDQSVASRPRSAILGNMLTDTTQFTTGPLTQRIANLRNVANRFGIAVNTEGLSAQESFNKLAAQLANAQGAGSDARLGVNVAANPHQELSPAGVDLMLRQLQGNEDYIQARAKIAQSSSATNIKDFESNVGTKLDPRAFQFARMTAQQRVDYAKGLSPQDRKAVQSSYNYAHDNGLVGG